MRPLKPHTQQLVEAEIARTRRTKTAAIETRKIALSDQVALLQLDPMRVLTGEVVVYDDRKIRTR